MARTAHGRAGSVGREVNRPGSAVVAKPGPTAAANQLSARGKRTRTTLINAARDVFEAAGFSEARVADIAQRAQVAYGSFYTYFESKEEIFREVLKQVTGEMFDASAVAHDAAATPLARLEFANRRYLQAYARNARIMAVIEEVAPYDNYSHELLGAIRRLFLRRIELGVVHQQKVGRLDGTLDPNMVARALGGMIEQTARGAFLHGEPYDEESAVHVLTTLWSNAVGDLNYG